MKRESILADIVHPSSLELECLQSLECGRRAILVALKLAGVSAACVCVFESIYFHVDIDKASKRLMHIGYGRKKDCGYRLETLSVRHGQLSALKGLLEEHDSVIVSTVTEYLPFSRFYDPANPRTERPGHVFLAMYHDGHTVYFYDDEGMIGPSGAHRQPGVFGVYKANLADFEAALRHRFDATVVQPLITCENDYVRILLNTVREMIDSYWSSDMPLGGRQRLFGRRAIEALIGSLISDEDALVNAGEQYGRSVVTYLLANVYLGRIALKTVLKIFGDRFGLVVTPGFFEDLEETIRNWVIVHNLIEKALVQGRVRAVQQSCVRRLTRLLLVEDCFYNRLVAFYAANAHTPVGCQANMPASVADASRWCEG